MTLFKALTSYLLFGLNLLLVFLLIFQNKIIIPDWLQTVGRMHPMLLHLPIGLLLLVVVLWLFRHEFEGVDKIFAFILSLTALSAVMTALMGLFLSKEGGYTNQLLNWHKYSGAGLSLLIYIVWWFFQNSNSKYLIINILLSVSTIVLVIAGHFGASLTHGEDYLFPNKNIATELVITGETTVFEAAIKPILKAKCFQCHNEQKTKGGLLMTTIAGLLKGGKNGSIWVAGNAKNSHLIQRANLPMDDKEHMAPRGKAQLTTQEIDILTTWIQTGADVKKQMKALAANDPLKKLIEKQGSGGSSVHESPIAYDFEPISKETIKKLNNPFRSVFALANESPALQADCFVRSEYKSQYLSELSEVKNQLIALNLSKMPVRDEDLKTIAQYANLEKLILNNTDILGKNMEVLQALTKLKSLSLSGTKVTKESITPLVKLPNLYEIFVWNTLITPKDTADLLKQNPKIHLHLGYIPNDAEKLKLNTPILVNESIVLNEQIPITFKHTLKGVTIRYTTNNTEPDSTSSTIYQKPFVLPSDYTIVKARGMKDQWLASSVVTYTFFKAKNHPEEVVLINEPNPKYIAEGGKTLIDEKKAELSDFKSGWLGFREKPFEALFMFKKPTPVKIITLSVMRGIKSSVMLPTSVEIWGGRDKNHLRLLKKVTPKQAQKGEPDRNEVIRMVLPEGSYQTFRVITRPLKRLPSWHDARGKPAWIMLDEVFFN